MNERLFCLDVVVFFCAFYVAAQCSIGDVTELTKRKGNRYIIRFNEMTNNKKKIIPTLSILDFVLLHTCSNSIFEIDIMFIHHDEILKCRGAQVPLEIVFCVLFVKLSVLRMGNMKKNLNYCILNVVIKIQFDTNTNCSSSND